MAIAEIIAATTGIFTVLKDGSSVGKTINDLNKEIDKLETNTALYRTEGSMTRFLSSYIIEPTAIVSKDLANEDVIENLLGLEADIFTGFYMQVFDILTKVNGMDATNAINLLSTDTSSIGSVINSGRHSLGKESFDYAANLMNGGVMPQLSVEVKQTTNSKGETIYTMTEKELNEKGAIFAKNAVDKHKNSIQLKNPASVADDSISKNVPGMIQRTVNLEIMTNNGGIKHIVRIPVVIKLHIMYVSIDNVITMMEPNSRDKSYSSRLDEYRAGAISLSDLLFAGDLIKEYKKNKVKDTDGLLGMMNKRSMSAYTKSLSNGGIGFENYYNMLIISETDRIILEKHIGGRIKVDKYKNALLEQTKSLMVTIVDRDYERVTLYTKDIHGKSDVTYKALSKHGGKSDDMSEIMKALIANKPPVF